MRTRKNSSSTGTRIASAKRVTITDAESGMYYPGTPTVTESTVTGNVVGSSMVSTMQDEVTPDFRKRIASGEVICNPMNSLTIIETESPIPVEFFTETKSCSYDKKDWSKHYTTWVSKNLSGTCNFALVTQGVDANLLSYPDLPDYGSEVQSVIDRAVSQSFANISQSEILLLATLAESKSTVAGLIQLMAQVTKIISSVVKGRPDLKRLKRQSAKRGFTTRKLKRALDDVAELYMNARYNLRPLYHDICGILKLFEDKPKHDRYTFRGYSSYQDKDDFSSTFVPTGEFKPNVGATLKFNFKKSLQVDISARAGVLTQLEDASIWTRAGINAIPQTMWELVPFSFIVDWFFNVGDTILAWFPEYGSTVLASWVTVMEQYTQRQEVRIHSMQSQDPPTPWAFPKSWATVNCSLSNAFRQKVTIRKRRIVSPQRPILPHLDVNLDSLKLLDLTIISKKLLLNRKIMTGMA